MGGRLLRVRSPCLTVAATLGAQLDRLCIAGGLVPNLLINDQVGPDPIADEAHPGTSDLDLVDGRTLAGERTTREVPVCGPHCPGVSVGGVLVTRTTQQPQLREPKPLRP